MLKKDLWPLQQDTEGSLRGLVRQLSIDQFENEGRRVDPESSAKHQKPPLFERTSMDPGSVHKVRLLPPYARAASTRYTAFS